ncbi:KilA-N domain-containing protein [Crateriforma conspicua]|uniref:KilA-N domain protein n=1 Tax=Crateriforma conspicua TaxID=2527996 RepID=A0A5C6FVT2_9PLAN|nr:KilA-N domain-containing protein [Crateriforma conspicua]TWU66466.1 KilA-N domain protein [Crateriforma conspicua]
MTQKPDKNALVPRLSQLPPARQVELGLIKHEVASGVIPQRASDGYVNATEMCRACGKQFSDYYRNKSTEAFLDAMANETGIPASSLVVIIKGGNAIVQGTWVHPQVAINLAQWCSPVFAVAVTKLVLEWMRGEFTQASVPYHIQRYMANRSEIPPTHFSMLNELTFGLIAPLEVEGYTVPDNMVPDISEGKMFSSWLRSDKKIDPKGFPRYNHRYADGRVVQARLYPNNLLQDFRAHFHDVWIPKRMIRYFSDRDARALPFIAQAFPLLANEVKRITGQQS